MAASTNCSSNVNCCATLRTYLVHREQRSTMTEERNFCSSTKITTRHLADAHAPANVSPTCARARWITRVSLFSRHISGTQLFRENRHVIIHLLVVHNPLVPLIGRLVACSARTRADRQTDRQNDNCNPRCACAPRVNKADMLAITSWTYNTLHGINITFLYTPLAKIQTHTNLQSH